MAWSVSAIIYFVFLTVLGCIELTASFNIDTKFPVVFSWTKGSYFGFQVGLHHTYEGPMALITAPRANSSFYRNSIHQPGILTKCHINTGSCQEIVLDKSGNSYMDKGDEFSYKDVKDDGYLGMALDIQKGGEGNVVTCGHLWKNHRFSEEYLANGVCYVINGNLEENSVQKLLPLIKRNKQNVIPPGLNYYSFGMAGFSAAFTQNGQGLFLGAPGVYEWTGTIISYIMAGKNGLTAIVPDPPKTANNHKVSLDSYIGYSVSSGQFFALGGTYIVSGAPREAQDKGRIYISEVPRDSQRPIFDVQKIKEGEQIGEYFGAAVLGIDVNADTYTDLLVGAPLYASTFGVDEGRVFVYISDGLDLNLQSKKLRGLHKSNARFGISIANLGDINQDGFLDVAIGAPFEDDTGAVYIYHGSSNGLKTEFAQRIAASDIDRSLSGFGFGIAQGEDINSNHYPDLLIGSYASDKAVLLRARPVVTIHPKLEFSTQRININDTKCFDKNDRVPCFHVNYCLSYSGKHPPNSISVNLSLQMDARRQGPPRGYILFRSNRTHTINDTSVLYKNKESCFDHGVNIYKDIKDIYTPVLFRLSYQLAKSSNADRQFCSTCAVLDETTPNFITREVTFWIGCGDDTICSSDLKLKAHIVGHRVGEPLIVGLNTSIVLDVEVYNAGESAYASEVLISLPENVGIINQAECHINSSSQSGSSLICGTGNPLQERERAHFQIKLDTSKLSINIKKIDIELSAITASQEVFPSDNNVTITLDFKAQAYISITGYPDKEQVYFGGEQPTDDAIHITHTFNVIKYLSSPIKQVAVILSVPTKLLDENEQFINLIGAKIDTSKPTAVSGNCNITAEKYIDPSKEEIEIIGGDLQNIKSSGSKSNYNSQQPKSQHLYSEIKKDDENVILNCKTTICQTIRCVVGPFHYNRNIAKIDIFAVINSTLLQKGIGQRETISVTSEGLARINDERYSDLTAIQRTSQTTVTTVLVKPGPPPPQEVETWIIVLSVIAGIILLALILFGLVQLGFFQRQKKDDMKKMMEQAKLLKPDGEASPEENGDSRKV